MMKHMHKDNRTVLTRLFSRRRGPARIDASREFLSSEEFSAQLETERARVDRSGYGFTIIVFSIQGVNTGDEVNRAEGALIAGLMERTRRCDTKGWHGAHPAVILPYTSKADAMNLTAPVELLFRKHFAEMGMPLVPGPRLSFIAYGYPHDTIPTNGTPVSPRGEVPASHVEPTR